MPKEAAASRRLVEPSGAFCPLIVERHAEARLQKRKIGDLFGFEPRQIIVQPSSGLSFTSRKQRSLDVSRNDLRWT